MKLLLEFILYIALAITLLYSSAWLFFSSRVESEIHASMDSIEAKITAKNVKLSYGEISVSGFPLKFKVEIESVKMITNLSEGSERRVADFVILFDEKIAIESGVFEKSTKIKFPNNFKFAVIDSTLSDEINFDKYNQIALEDGVFEFKMKRSPIEYLMLSGNPYPFTLERLSQGLTSISYKDSGVKISKTNAQKPFLQIDSNQFSLQNYKQDDLISIDIKFAMNNLLHGDNSYENLLESVGQIAKSDKKNLTKMTQEAQKLGKISYVFDVSYQGVKFKDLPMYNDNQMITLSDFTSNINEISIKNDLYSFNISGNIEQSEVDIFPYGELNIEANNYVAMLENWSGFISKIFSVEDIANTKTSDEIVAYNIARLSNIIKAANENESDKNASLSIKKAAGGELTVGKLSLKELISAFNRPIK